MVPKHVTKGIEPNSAEAAWSGSGASIPWHSSYIGKHHRALSGRGLAGPATHPGIT